MKKIYASRIRWAVIFLLRSITAFAKKHAADEEVFDESGNRRTNLKHILNCVEFGITTKWNANFSLTAKPIHILIPSRTEDGQTGLRFPPFIQFTHLEFRSLN
jgi:hypothetical protein